jgi:hypothetical protein
MLRSGAPGRGTLHEFAFGAVAHHFMLSLSQSVGSTFRYLDVAKSKLLNVNPNNDF